MGVLVSLKYAMAHGDHLTAMVLMNGVYGRTDEQLAGIRARVADAETNGPGVLIDAALDRWLSPEFRAAHQEAVAAIRARLEANDPDDFLTAYRIFAGADPEIAGRLGGISCPALVTTGELDRGSTPGMARAMAEALPNADCVILPGLRHLPTTEGPEQVNSLLRNFLDRTVPR
jgi:pimeloyl-ACP methyl ester carboxylesterase